MKRAIKLFIMAVFALCSTALAENGDTLRPRYGAFINYGLNIHAASFGALPGVPNCCPQFESGSGSGLSFGGLIEYPLSDKFTLGARLGFFSKSGLLKKEETTLVEVDLKPAQGVFEHRLDASLSVIEIQPLAGYRLFRDAFVHLGAGAGFFIGKKYDQIEEIIKPEGVGVFTDTKTRTRNAKSGDISALSSPALSIIAGLSYELPLNAEGTMKLAPEAFFSYGLNDVAKDIDWKIHSFRGGISVKYTPFENIYVYRQNINIDTIERKSEVIAARTVSQGLPKTEKIRDKTDYTITITENYSRTDTLLIPVEKPKPKEEPKPEKKHFEIALDVSSADKPYEKPDKINIQVQFAKDVYPLLPFVFFGESAYVIPARYAHLKHKKDFEIDKLDPSPLAYHRNVLNIIGYRLEKNASAKLTLFGYADPTTETENCSLAQDRALAIKNYLTTVWGISADRIIISAKPKNCYPEDLTRTQSDDGFAENRRVEITSTHPEILSPVNIRRYERPIQVSPKGLDISVTPSEAKDLKSWKINLKQNIYDAFAKTGTSSTVKHTYTFGYKDVASLTNGEIEVSADAETNDGEKLSKSIAIRVVKDTADTEIESITLTLFKVSQSRLDERIKREIFNFVAGLDSRAVIRIKGYSDFLGVETDNRALSESRAQQVRDYIRTIAPNVKFDSVEGIGSQEFPPGVNSYATPEERFLCRTVEIEIRKKFQK